MSWRIRHQGSPQSVDVPALPQVVEGLQDGVWETTDEVMGPEDSSWIAIENHPQLAEVVDEIEQPPRKFEDDETRLDMNPLIDVALVLLIFFILTTSYAALQRVLSMPTATSQDVNQKVRVVPADQVKKKTIRVEVRKVDDKPVFKVEQQVVEEKDLADELAKYVRDTSKTEMLLDVEGVDWGTVVKVQDAAKAAGVLRSHFLVKPQKKA